MFDNNQPMRHLLVPLFLCLCPLLSPGAKETFCPVGTAHVDITTDYAIPVSGRGVRQKESEGSDQPIFAQALAIGGDKKSLAILIAVYNVPVPACMCEQ